MSTGVQSVVGVQLTDITAPNSSKVLTPQALTFVAELHRRFNPERERLLARRTERQAEFTAGRLPDFLPETKEIRRAEWQVNKTPADLEKRWVEITGPVERKMMINALNSGANGFMADFEDSLSPTWENVVAGQINLRDAVRRAIEFTSPEGKAYTLKERTAVLMVRPRGWHLVEKHCLVDGQPISASLFDFGFYFFHNAKEALNRGTGPYFYLPKLESHLEARLWNDVFKAAQDQLSIPRGTIRATVLIETLPAAFEMDEILYELRDHIAALNAGRWDYIFSTIKKRRNESGFVLPDRAQITMNVPFMRAYTELLVKTCHARGAHAIGGMAAFIPSHKDKEVNERALAAVRADKEREVGDGFEGTWVAHPGLVPIAMEAFKAKLGDKPHQKERRREEVQVSARDLLNAQVPGGRITEAGVRSNTGVALQYLNAWLMGNGAAAIYNLMEDVATAEISRAQLWQWMHKGAQLDDGRVVTAALYKEIRDDELARLGNKEANRFDEAAEILDGLVLNEQFTDFLTYPAYDYL
ncbi:MAG: malate synthase A [Pyrinomonadaceae bacterium]|nr:malate synthase A [Pyrinomonadaceae bacterium]